MAIKSEYKPTKIPEIAATYGTNAGLGQKIETVLLRGFQRVFTWGWEFFADVAVYIFDQWMKILKPGMMRMFDPFLTEIERLPGLPENIKAMIERVRKEEGEAGAIGLGTLVVVLVGTLVNQAVQPIGSTLQQGVDSIVRSQLPPVSSWIRLFYRGKIDDELYHKLMRFSGLQDGILQGLEKDAENVPALGDLMEMRRRKLIADFDFEQGLRDLMIPEGYFSRYKEIMNVVPPINDLVRFMVREAFNEEAVQHFGYDDDYPTDIDQFLPQVGLTPDWGKRYWRAHWSLPSPTQAFEMLHRGEITRDDLRDLLKTADYPSFWRDKLMNISYNVMTRVDVRRLLQAGIIDAKKAEETYLKMGYTPEDAKLLTDFAVRGITQDEKDLTRTDILSSYEDGLTDRGSTSTALVKMGYDEQESEAILKQADFNIAKAQRTDVINYVGERYRAKIIERGAVTAELTAAGLKQTSIDRYLLQWDRVNETDVKLPSLADAKRFFSKDYIDEAKFRDILRLNKIPQEYIDLYVREVTDAKSEASVGG